MNIMNLMDRDTKIIKELFNVWYASVLETHDFLSKDEIDAIASYVPQALQDIQHLSILKDTDGRIQGFIGVDGTKVEMLFIAPQTRGRGYGKALLIHAIESFDVEELAVNEQNPKARAFYEYMGFEIISRSPLDDQGNPYPILNMRLKQ